jgi:uncharacterized protein (TIGR02598 family)
MRERSGFSLVEVTLAIGVIGFGLIAVLALIPVGIKSGGESIDATRTSLVTADIQNRVRASITNADFPIPPNNPTERSLVAFYDRDGVWIDTANLGMSSAFYRARASLGSSWASALPNVDEHYLRPVAVDIAWPVNPSTGNPLGNTRASFTFYVRRP